jgi:hypothetical protein
MLPAVWNFDILFFEGAFAAPKLGVLFNMQTDGRDQSRPN